MFSQYNNNRERERVIDKFDLYVEKEDWEKVSEKEDWEKVSEKYLKYSSGSAGTSGSSIMRIANKAICSLDTLRVYLIENNRERERERE